MHKERLLCLNGNLQDSTFIPMFTTSYNALIRPDPAGFENLST